MERAVADRLAQGLACQRKGALPEAQAIYLHVLQQMPGHADALHLLGTVRRQQGRYAESIALLRQAVSARPGEAVFISNLGNALRDAGELVEAEQAYREALRIKPDFAQALNNHGVLLLRQRRLGEALSILQQALASAPEFADAVNNMGFARMELGQFDEAMACFARALALQPMHQDARYNLGNCAVYAGDLGGAVEHFRVAERLDTGSASGRASTVRQALVHYLLDLPHHARADLARMEASPDVGQTSIYRQYMASLLDWRDAAPAEGVTDGKLHAIGESHVLSVHSAVLDVQGVRRRCQGWWIEGCKQWHLANGQPNRFKAQFTSIFERLPPASWILVVIGEIDCRHDDGLLAAWRKSEGRSSLDSMIVNTAQGYVRYASRLAASHGHKLVFSGVPASNFPADRMRAEDRPVLAQLIADFNGVLEQCVLAEGHQFLDLFSLTVAPDGFSNGLWHLDAHHLRPDAWAAAPLR